jgi:hypothetical protein
MIRPVAEMVWDDVASLAALAGCTSHVVLLVVGVIAQAHLPSVSSIAHPSVYLGLSEKCFPPLCPGPVAARAFSSLCASPLRCDSSCCFSSRIANLVLYALGDLTACCFWFMLLRALGFG